MKHNRISLVGKTFGRIKVLQFSHKDKHGNVYYVCKCTCGIVKTIAGNHLVSKRIISCGCSKKKNNGAVDMNKQIINLRTLLRCYLKDMGGTAVYTIIGMLNEYVSTNPEYSSIALVANK